MRIKFTRGRDLRICNKTDIKSEKKKKLVEENEVEQPEQQKKNGNLIF
jgi:hypothetical protein